MSSFGFQWLKMKLLEVEDLNKTSAGSWRRTSIYMLKLPKMMAGGEEKMSLVQMFCTLAAMKMQVWISREDVDKW